MIIRSELTSCLGLEAYETGSRALRRPGKGEKSVDQRKILGVKV